MKKDYMKPQMTAVEIQAEQFIATSPLVGDTEDVDTVSGNVTTQVSIYPT